MKEYIATGAKVTTDQWTGYAALSKTLEKQVRIPSGKKGNNFPELHRAVMNQKG